MFTEAEFHALSGSLSNDSRVLYCLGLRPTTDLSSAQSDPLNYKYLISLLNGNKPDSGEYTRGQQVNALLGELEQAGLIALMGDITLASSLSGHRLLLPLCKADQDDFTHLHRQFTAIHGRWRPDPVLYDEMTNLIGLIDRSFDDEDIGEFVSYWLGRPDAVFSHFQWTQKFAYAIKRKRVAVGHTASRKVGTQTVPVAAGIEADDNARKLVEKYASQKKS